MNTDYSDERDTNKKEGAPLTPPKRRGKPPLAPP